VRSGYRDFGLCSSGLRRKNQLHVALARADEVIALIGRRRCRRTGPGMPSPRPCRRRIPIDFDISASYHGIEYRSVSVNSIAVLAAPFFVEYSRHILRPQATKLNKSDQTSATIQFTDTL